MTALDAARGSGLVVAGEPLLVMLSGGADSVCLLDIAIELEAGVSALHVNHGLRGAESEEDARFCRERLRAEVVDAPGTGLSEAELRDLRYSFAPGRLRATGHTASDQVETILYRLAARGTTTGIRVRRDDGVVRPLLTVWRQEADAYCRAEGLSFASTVRILRRFAAISGRRSSRPCAAFILPPRRTSSASSTRAKFSLGRSRKRC
jgi:tRNA(Ile)-lysidine synthase